MTEETRDKAAQAVPWRWEEDGYTVTRSSAWSAPGCHEGCGVLLYADKQGKLVKVEGDVENPFNQGRLCVRCLALPQYVNHPDRLKYPMKRVGKRGEDKWERISWDEAYDTIEAEFNQKKKDFGADSVIFCQGTGRDIGGYITRLSYSFGSPNYSYFLSGNACYLPRVAAMMATSGCFTVVDCSQYFPDRYDNPKWEVPKCIVIWGNNTVVSNADGFYGHWIVDCMKRGTKLIVIDPKLTWLASRADIWLQIRPGTDSALALGLLNVIISEGLYDREFVDNWTYGFEELGGRAGEYPLDRVSDITWIPEEKIVAAARMFAASKPAAIQWGLAVDMTKESTPATHAISALWTITGNLDVPGGMMAVEPPFGIDDAGWGTGGYDLLSEEMQRKRVGLGKYPILDYGFPLAQPDEMVKMMTAPGPSPFKAAWLQTTNPLACTAQNPKLLSEGLSKLDFIVVVDVVMTPTAMAHADIVLPAASFVERDGLRSVWYSVGAINKAVDLGETRSDMQINLEIGHRFNPQAWPWKNVQEFFSGMLQNTGLSFEELRELGLPLYPSYEYRKHEKGLARRDGSIGFNTPTGRVELYSTLFAEWGLDPLPYFEEPTESPVSRPDLYEEYPLVLTTGARTWGFFHSEHRHVPRLRALKPDPEVQMHPDTATKYGIVHGDWVWIENAMGRCRQRAHVTPAVHPRVVQADHGWWFPEQKADAPNLYGVWDVNVNQLIPWLPGRSGFGTNCKSLLCKIYKVKDEEM